MKIKSPKKITSFLVGALSIYLLTGISGLYAASGINKQVNFQGRLQDSAGEIVADGDYNIRFKIYQDGDGDLGGGDETLQWTEEHKQTNRLRVENGYFSAQLGSVTAFGSSVDWNQDTLWLSIDVGGTNDTASPTYDGEMDPFVRLTSTPYALNSDLLDGLDSTDFLQSADAVTSLNGLATDLTIQGTANEISVTDNATDTITVGLPDDVTIGSDLTVTDTTTLDGHVAAGDGATVDGNSPPTDSLSGLSSRQSIVNSSETITSSGSSSSAYTGVLANVELDPSSAPGYGQAAGLFGLASVASGNSENFSTPLYGFNGGVIHGGSGTLSGDFTGINAVVYNAGGGDVSSVSRGVNVVPLLGASGTISTFRGIDIQSPINFGAASVTNNYGLYINDQSSAGTSASYNIYSVGGSSKNYFAGSVGIGDDSPASLFTVGSGDPFQINNSGVITSGSYQGTAIADSYVANDLTINSSGSVDDGALSSNVSLLEQTIESSEITDGTVTGTDIANNTIEEIDLEATNTPTDDYVLSYDSASGGFTWVEGGGSGFAIGDSVTNSPTSGGLVYSDGSDQVANDQFTVGDVSYFGGAVTGNSLTSNKVSNVPFIQTLDLSGFSTPNALGFAVNNHSGSLNFVDVNTLTSYWGLVYDPATPANRSYAVALANGTAGTPELGITTTDFDINLDVDVNSNQINNLADPTLDQDAATKKYVDDELVASGISSAFINDGNSFAATATLGTNDNNSLEFETNGSSRAFLDTSGNFGVGDSTPDFTLEVAGKIGIEDTQIAYLPNQTDYVGTIIYGNGGASLSHVGVWDGTYNTILGIDSGTGLTSGNGNTAAGNSALKSTTTGTNNTAFGRNALKNSTTGTNNVAVGFNTLSGSNTGTYNVAIGSDNLTANTSGNHNIAIGRAAAESITTGANNLGIGSTRTLNKLQSGSSNIALGGDAGYDIVSGANNVLIGEAAGRYTTGSNTTAIGYKAGFGSATSASANNTFLGYQSGDNVTTGSNNIVIGYDVDLPAATDSNKLVLGNLLYGTGLTSTGTTVSTGKIGIGTAAPAQKLDVAKGATVGSSSPTANNFTVNSVNRGAHFYTGEGSTNGYASGVFASGEGPSSAAFAIPTLGSYGRAGLVGAALNTTGGRLATGIYGFTGQEAASTAGSNTGDAIYGLAQPSAVANISAGDWIGIKGKGDISQPTTLNGTPTAYGGHFTGTAKTGGDAVGLYATATGGDNNYAGIFEAGNVGIGNTSPSHPLDVTGKINNSGDIEAGDGLQWNNTGTQGTGFSVCYVGTGPWEIRRCSSSERFKKNIKDLSVGGLDTVNSLIPREYDRKNTGEHEIGFIAEQAEKVVPGLAVYDEDGSVFSFQYQNYTAVLTKAIQELDDKVNGKVGITAKGMSNGDLRGEVSILQGDDGSDAFLRVSGSTITKRLEVRDDAVFEGDIFVKGSLVLNEDNAGEATIKAGDVKVDIDFSAEYEHQPIVNATQQDWLDGQFRVVDKNTDGFTIELQRPQDEDVTFDWHSFAGQDTKEFVSGEKSNKVKPVTQKIGGGLGF